MGLGRFGRSIQAYIDEPVTTVAAGAARFRGWVASETPIQTLALEIEGHREDVRQFQDRSDVVEHRGATHVVGWVHLFRIATDVVQPRPVRVSVIVNGRPVLAQTLLLVAAAKSDYVGEPDRSSTLPRDLMVARARGIGPTEHVAEIGTRQAVDGTSTNVFDHFMNVPRENYLMIDVEAGRDVDLVGDLHRLPAAMSGRFSAVVAIAVFEHLERPWIAAAEVARIMKAGGFCYIATHQCFPLHGYPSDFFRFSTEALSLILEDAGLRVVEAAYQHRVQIAASDNVVPLDFQDEWNARWPSYLNVHVIADKPG
jgi:SAM-dependent methyltransferase